MQSAENAYVAPTAEVEEEEEPQLKYHRLGADVVDILRRDEACSLCVSEKMLALGTHSGTVYLLSCAGDEVQAFYAHKGAVQDICFDEEVESLGSCSDDGTLVVRNLITDEVIKINHHRPLTALAIDPKFSRRKTREVVSGGVAGRLVLSSRGWLGMKDVPIHTGQGHVHTVKWSGNLVAWANDLSIKIYNTALHKHAGTVNKPDSVQAGPLTECFLYWHPDGTLYIGWATTVMIVSFVPNESGHVIGQDSVRILTKFDTEGVIAGVAPFGQQLAVLAYMKDPTDAESAKPLRPEIRVLTKKNAEISSDALSINGFEQYEANDYKLVPCYPTSCARHDLAVSGAPAKLNNTIAEESTDNIRSRCFIQWWKDGEEPLYYVVSPKDIFIGAPRDEMDRVEWLLEHKRYAKALSVASVIRKRDAETWEKVVDKYIEHLISEKKIEEAAKMTPELLGDDPVRWERYVYIFAASNNLSVLSSYVPIENPTLKANMYNMILRSCIPFPQFHQQLQILVQKWPPSIYSPVVLAKDIHQKLHAIRGDRIIVMEVLAKLYVLQNLHERALDIYLQLKRSEVFEFVVQHGLLSSLTNKITRLLDLDEDRTLELLCRHADEIQPHEVVEEVNAAMKSLREKDPNEKQVQVFRKWLYRYMDQLVLENISAAPDYHYLLVELYADYEPAKLMRFLQMSHQYPLDQAYDICKERKLVREMVYILSRMGNAQDALQLIIKELEDVPQAIEFVREQHDDDLWDPLIDWAVQKASTTGDLLDHVSGHVDPQRFISRIPKGAEIWNLRNRLCRIIADYRNQTSLQEGCSKILEADCVQLTARLYSRVRHCLREVFITEGGRQNSTWQCYDSVTGGLRSAAKPSMETAAHASLDQDDASGLDVPLSARSLRIGFLLEDASANVEGADSTRSMPARRRSSYEETTDHLPSLIK